MHIVTGGAGFIGSNLVRHLIARGHDDVVVVDDLTDGRKFANIADCAIADYLDKDEFLARLEDAAFAGNLRAIFHEGACSTTTEWDGRYMMRNNYRYSVDLLEYCQAQDIPFIYASSAAVYGGGRDFREERPVEAPLNALGEKELCPGQAALEKFNASLR